MRDMFPDELIPHCEFIKFNGNVTMSALPVVRFSGAARLNAIMAAHEASGVMIANPHVVSLEDGSRHKRVDADQMGFKAEIDPHGLLNPGKMASYIPAKPL
jgi:FAD/FMN-containing dehydrogenase